MESQFKGSGGVLDQTMEESGATNPGVQWKQMGYEEKTAAVHEEMNKMNRLPATSNYVTHRLRVLNKILQLLSIQVIKDNCCLGLCLYLCLINKDGLGKVAFEFSR